MKTWESFEKELLKDKQFAREYKALEPQYALISRMIGLRIKEGLTQKELAKRIGTKQSAIARFESGRYNPSVKFLQRAAKGLGSSLTLSLK